MTYGIQWIHKSRVLVLVVFHLLVIVCTTAAASDKLYYHDSKSTQPHATDTDASTILIDSRNTQICQSETVSGAICLSPVQLAHPDGQLASMRDINWLFGTLGIDERATAIVFGDSDHDIHFVASLIYILGQARVGIWRTDTMRLFQQNPSGAGIVPGLLRKRFYRATLRDKDLVLDSDVRQFFSKTTMPPVPVSDFQSAQIYRRNDGTELVLAQTTRDALIGFAKTLASNAGNGPHRTIVHITGLAGRAPSDLGAPETSKTGKTKVIIIASAVLLLMLFTIWHSFGWFIRRRNQ